MPLTDRGAVFAYSSLTPGAWRVLHEEPTANPSGPDVMEVTWLADFRGVKKTTAEIVAMFPLGARYGDGDMELWLKGCQPFNVGGNAWRVQARYEGALSVAGKPHQVVLMGSASSHSISYTAPSGGGSTVLWESWLPFPIVLNSGGQLLISIRENTPGFEYSYYQRGSPRTWATGLGQFGGTSQIVPPVALAVNEFGWGGIGSNRWSINVPAGFVFEDLRTDPIATAPQVNWVTEAWTFTPIFKPIS